MTLRLPNVDTSENQRPKKSGTPSTSSSLTLATTYGDVLWTGDDGASTAILDVANSPSVGGVIKWTHSTGATLDLEAWLSNDATMTIAAPAPFNETPTAGDGISPAYPQQVEYAKADWVVGAATVTYVPFTVFCPGHRYVKLNLKANAAAGSAIVYLAGGTN